MPDLSIQFHATPDEMLPVLAAAIESGAKLFALRTQPFSTVAIGDQESVGIALEDRAVCSFAVVDHEPAVDSIGSEYDFLLQNPATLLLEVGRLTDAGLRESCLSCKSVPAETYAKWKKVAAALRKITKAGAIARSPTTQATSRARDHRHTQGARRLAANGVPILPAAGTSRLEFIELP